MPRRTGLATKDYLKAAALPVATQSYTVIPHDFIITNVETELKAVGLEIERELYKATIDAKIASGVLHLKQGDDQEMRMMFVWANSYDKSMRFKCAIGGYLPQSQSIIVSANMGSWGRKHTGTADQETLDTIKHQISSADYYYKQLIRDKDNMKNIKVTDRRKAELMGILYFEHGLLTAEQLGIVKAEDKKPSFVYNSDKDSLWMLYCNIIFSLQKSHPRTWLDQQRLIHFFICDIFDIDNTIVPQPVVQPAVENVTGEKYQMTIHDVIAEEESKIQ